VPEGMMSEPPECRGDETSTRGHRTPLRQPESPAGVLFGERGEAHISVTGSVSTIVTNEGQ